MSKTSIFVNGTKEFAIFYNSLSESNLLKKKLDGAIDLLKKNPTLGNKIQVKLFPNKYVRKHGIRNLYRYPLGSNHRLLYTIVSRQNEILCIILDVLDHKEYDQLFGYKTS